MLGVTESLQKYYLIDIHLIMVFYSGFMLECEVPNNVLVKAVERYGGRLGAEYSVVIGSECYEGHGSFPVIRIYIEKRSGVPLTEADWKFIHEKLSDRTYGDFPIVLRESILE